ncbi:MAG TPA: hypothetical protein VFA38_02010, partial [Nitrospirales bacterium]|nr:hypothetical protein [Nitrospirales bacterium]
MKDFGPGTIEFIWVLLLWAAFVGLSFARPPRMLHTPIEPRGRWWTRLWAFIRGWGIRLWVFIRGGWRTCLSSVSAAEWRWWFFIVLLFVAAGFYYHYHEIHRIVLNLLLYFEWHPIFTAVLLVLGVIAFLYARRGELSRRGVVVALGLAGLTWLFNYKSWSCLIIILAWLTLLGALWMYRYEMRRRMWVGLTIKTYYVTAMFLAWALFALPEIPRQLIDYGYVAIGIVFVGGIGWWWWHRRLMYGWSLERYVVLWTCGFSVALMILGIVLAAAEDFRWSWWYGNVLEIMDDLGDYGALALGVILIGVVYSLILRAHVQPLGWASALLVLFLSAGIILHQNLYGHPQDFEKIEDQFKYGSIGSDHFLARGFPALLWEILPERYHPSDVLTKDIHPATDTSGGELYRPRFDIDSYEALGLWVENDRKVRLEDEPAEITIDRPIGFSKRRVFGLDFYGMNCALCHSSTVRTSDHPQPRVIPLMPANTFDIEL